MKKLTQKEVEKENGNMIRRGSPENKFQDLHSILDDLKIDEAVKVTTEDWVKFKTKTPIQNIISNLNVKNKSKEPYKKFSVRTLIENEGWLVIRVR